MEKQREKRSRASLPRLVIPFLVFLAALEGGLLGAQNAEISLQGDRFTLGDRITFDVRIFEPDPSKVALAPLSFPSGLSLIAGPYIKPSVWKDGTKQISGTVATYQCRVTSDGVVTLGPFTVRIGEKEFKSDSKTLFLLKTDEAGRRFPLEYSWSPTPGPYYETQAIPLSFYVGNLGYLPNLEGVPLAVPGNALLERAPGIAEMEVRQLGGDSLFKVPYDNWILIPLRAGSLMIPPTAYQIDGLQRTTPLLRLDILPLPPEVKESRAVGSFTYSAEIRQKSVPMGGEFTLVQELKGVGNFPYLLFPKTEFPGFVVLSQDSENEFKPGSKGYVGYKRLLTRLSPQTSGPLTLILPGYTWMAPDSGRVFVAGQKAQTVDVTQTTSALDSNPEDLAFLGWNEILQVEPWVFYLDPFSFLLLIPGILVFLVFFVRSSLRKFAVIALVPLLLGTSVEAPNQPPQFTQALHYYSQSRFDDARKSLEGVLAEHPNNPGILYNLALTEYKGGKILPALQSLRRSLNSGVELAVCQSLLKEIETTLGVTDQWRPAPAVSPWIFWVLGMIFANLFLILGGFWIRSRRMNLLPPLVASVLLLGVTMGLYTSLKGYQEAPAGILGVSQGSLQRVPGDKAERWMSLAGGTSVRILGKNKGYSFIQTGYGLEGWLDDREILRTDGAYFSR